MKQFGPKQVIEHLQQAETQPVLLDVRQPHEVEICAIEGSINIPLGEVPASLDKLDPDQEYILICHHGMRSLQAGLFLANQGFGKLINLVGGIDAWAKEIAPDMARY